MASRLQRHVAARIEAAHGEDIAALFDIYVGRAHVYYNPKIRLERLIYRGIREAANASRSIEQRERARRSPTCATSLRERARLRRLPPDRRTRDTKRSSATRRWRAACMRTLRSPEVMFDVAAEADLIWELSRLCRARALEGMETRSRPASCSSSTSIRTTSPIRRSTRTEVEPIRSASSSRSPSARRSRTIPKFRERLKAFRDLGFRFAVDDAGSGYAGLGLDREPRARLHQARHLADQRASTRTSSSRTSSRRWCSFANDHGAMVIAEGVERAEEFETVQELGVHLVQGFFLHRPQRREHDRSRARRARRPRSSAHQLRDQPYDRSAAPSPARTTSRAASPEARRAHSIVEPRFERRFERRRRPATVAAARAASSSPASRLPCVPRPEEHRRAERRRLEHRVQSGGVKSAADERDVGERIEIAEHADAIDEHDVGLRRVRGAEPRTA